MKKHILLLSKNKFIQGGAILTIANFVVSFFNYLFNSFSAKALGPQGYGEIAAFLSYVNIFSIPLLVITTIIVRRLGYAGTLRLHVAFEFIQWFWTWIKKWWPLLPLYLATALILPPLTNLTQLTSTTLVLILLIHFFGSVYLALSQGLHLFLWFAFALMLMSVIRFSGALGALLELGGLELIYAMTLVGFSLPLIIGLHVTRRLKTTTYNKSSYKLQKKLRNILQNRDVVITAVSMIAITLLSNIDVAYVKKFYPAQEAGLYSAWSLFVKIILYFIGPLNILSLIFFSSKETRAIRKKAMYFILISFLLIGASMFIIYSYFGKFLITVIFTREFFSITPLLGKAALFGILYTYLTILNNYFIAHQDTRSLAIAVTIPVYIAGLFLFGSSISVIITINILFTATLTALYLLFLFRSS